MIVSVDKNTRCHGQLHSARKFGVSFLSEEQEAISTVFAKRGDPEQGSLRGVPFHAGPHGTPLLDGAIAYLECRVSDVLPGGDHDLFVGEALGGEIVRSDAPPLLFFRGRYRKIG
jgi:flavin reductase (DIM6/NTAB) family NADH-FMN oxidoreductase RutF